MIGILLIICGIADALYEFGNNDAFLVEGHHGVILLGLGIFLKCFDTIAFGMMFSDEAMTHKKSRRSQPFFAFLHKFLHHWGFDLVLSLSLIITGTAEIFEALWHHETPEESAVWFLGMILLGIVNMIKVGTKMFTVVFRISNAAERLKKDLGSKTAINTKIFYFIRQPRVELAAAVLIMLFCILEEVLNAQEKGLSSHHGLFVFGLFHMMRIIPSLSESLEVWKDSIEK